MARDNLNPREKQFPSTFQVQGKEGVRFASFKDEFAECSGRNNCDDNGVNFNLVSAPSRLPPVSPTLRMPLPCPIINSSAHNSSLNSFQQPRIGHGFQILANNSPSLHQIVPGTMDPFFNNMQNVATNRQGFQNPQFGRVLEPATFHGNGNNHMAMLERGVNSNNIYQYSTTENVGHFNTRASILSVGEEIGSGNSILQSSSQSQENIDGFTLGDRGNMDLPSVENSRRGTIPTNSENLIFPQVSYDVQNTTANPSIAGTGGYLGVIDYMNRDVLADYLQGSGSDTSKFRLDQIRAPESSHTVGQHFIPPNRNLESHSLSQGLLSEAPVTGFSNLAILTTSRESRGTEIPTLYVNSAQPGSGRLDNQNLFQLPGSRMGNVEPISLNNNAQPFSDQLHRFPETDIGEFSSQSSASASLVTWRNQSGNPGQPLSIPALQSFRNYFGPAFVSNQAASLERSNASTQALPVHIRPSLKRGASEIAPTTSLYRQKKLRETSPYQSVPHVPLTIGAPRSSAQTISSHPQLFMAKSTPPVPNPASLRPLVRTSSSVRTLPQSLPSMSTAAPIPPSAPQAASLRMPIRYRVRSNPVSVPSQMRLLANSTPDAQVQLQGLNEHLHPTGEKCYLCKRDLSFAPEGPLSQPRELPDVAVLPCRHTFHDTCLRKITPPDLAASPPCIPCALGET